MRVFITGISKYLGSFLAEYLSGFPEVETITGISRTSSPIPLTIFRPSFIIGPHDRTYIPGVRQNPIRYPGRNPRTQYIHEDDLGAAFLQAMRTDLPGAYNLVPDDYLCWGEILKILGVKFAVPTPSWLARWYMSLRRRYLGDRLHPDGYDTLLFDWVISNSKLRETGWAPRFSSADALRSALTPV